MVNNNHNNNTNNNNNNNISSGKQKKKHMVAMDVTHGLLFQFRTKKHLCRGQLNCYSGTVAATITQTGCTSCQTTVTYSGSAAITTSSCVASCAQTDTTALGLGVKTFCCSTNLCNPPNATFNGPSAGLRCYVGDSMATQSNCQFCKKTVSSILVTTIVSRSCENSCSTIEIGPIKSTCCQTDFCNQATTLATKFSLISAITTAIIAYLVIKF
ncbi:hypothetical protein HELRODRAFT_163651 [Helobdella robusta]|uniref:UPAR/Ly6 domain-containing protein n=1 Tax=Helobdella robusta TaxID=6412 RepID=T1EUB6_HELRO|nr:hypothetical protein HELRODRAFT_163651 [Helobdella robusta]ESN96574.1 hypothetical protein HELRODRAFT_163651 [Helobdella robusta]